MKPSLMILTLFAGLDCARPIMVGAAADARHDGIEFSFVPSDDQGFVSPIPISTHGACGTKGALMASNFGLVIDSVEADGRPVEKFTVEGGIYEGPPPLYLDVVSPDRGFTYLVLQRDLSGFFYGWTEKKPPPGFVPPPHGRFHGHTFNLRVDFDSPLEILIKYHVRCADMSMSPMMSTRGQNGFALARRRSGQPSNKPLQQTVTPP